MQSQDLASFQELIRQHKGGLFSPDLPVIITRAPGRLDVMGGIADYSGSLVLELPTAEATLTAIQLDEQPRLKIFSHGADREGGLGRARVPRVPNASRRKGNFRWASLWLVLGPQLHFVCEYVCQCVRAGVRVRVRLSVSAPAYCLLAPLSSSLSLRIHWYSSPK